ncbi:MAG: choloylglycine hydrolase family protein [Ruminococcaceae bacterium]|nr:choloylglycine hydrolase family protein [Oscillospiraceae bacterium]
MCTALSFSAGNHYFGRNLDVKKSYGQKVVVTPKGYKTDMRSLSSFRTKYAMLGMAITPDNFPLYFEATNEKGLSIAGLNFPDNAHYNVTITGKSNVTPFELPLWLLGLCESVKQARAALSDCNIVNISFSAALPLSPLHWMLADKDECIVIESTKDGLKIYDNPFEVLTNNPPFDWHLMNMNNYLHLHNAGSVNANNNSMAHNYSLGLGALGLPGDFSSASRFVKAAFVKNNSVKSEDETENVSQFFHILASVSMPKGCVMMPKGAFEFTLYSCCCNTDKGIFYYNTYDNSTVRCINIHDYEAADSAKLIIIGEEI